MDWNLIGAILTSPFTSYGVAASAGFYLGHLNGKYQPIVNGWNKVIGWFKKEPVKAPGVDTQAVAAEVIKQLTAQGVIKTP
jgi:hypothetical protein